jgi:enoyl-CoA hydratase/carnithine racemase
MSDQVLVDIRDGVAEITINRPHRRNAIDKPTADALAAALDALDAGDQVRVGIITGAGGYFCAGMDLKALTETGERPVSESRGALGIAERPPDKPLIAAVEGPALGGGFELALACDLIVAAASATFGLPEVTRGLVAGGGGLIRLPRRVPRNVALELVLTGGRLSASRAEALGLVNRLAERGEALTEARALAGMVAAGAPLASRVSKEIVNESVDWPMVDAFAMQADRVQLVRDSQDAMEGTAAFVAKRTPVWKGR